MNWCFENYLLRILIRFIKIIGNEKLRRRAEKVVRGIRNWENKKWIGRKRKNKTSWTRKIKINRGIAKNIKWIN